MRTVPGAIVRADLLDAGYDRFDVAAAALTSYDPREDRTGAVLEVARAIAGGIAQRLTPIRH